MEEGEVYLTFEDCSYFDPAVAQRCLESVIRKYLDGQVYNADKVPDWMDGIMTDLRGVLQAMDLSRYKRVINVNILRLTEGTTMNITTECFWDEETDRMTSYTYRNDSILCNAVIYAVYVD